MREDESAGAGILYLTASIESLYHGLMRLDVRYVGNNTQKITLLNFGQKGTNSKSNEVEVPLRILEVDAANNAYLNNAREIVLTPNADGPPWITLLVPGITDDSGWYSYPLMHGHCNLEFQVAGGATTIFRCLFPKYIHPLPRLTTVISNGQTKNINDYVGYDHYTGYPEVQLSYTVELRGSPENTVVFDCTYREAAQTIVVPLLLPFVINFFVILIGTLFGQAKGSSAYEVLYAARIPMVIAIIPLYVTLWNSSNVLRAVPTIVNLITSSMFFIVTFNMAIAITWFFEKQFSVFPSLLISAAYFLLLLIVSWNTIGFMISGDMKAKPLICQFQKALYWIKKRVVEISRLRGRS